MKNKVLKEKLSKKKEQNLLVMSYVISTIRKESKVRKIDCGDKTVKVNLFKKEYRDSYYSIKSKWRTIKKNLLELGVIECESIKGQMFTIHLDRLSNVFNA